MYPRDLREAGISGSVVLSFVIDTTGRADPDSIEVVSSTNIGFINPAIGTVRSCRFVPAVKDGHPVRVRVTQPINFSVDLVYPRAPAPG